MSTLRRLSVSLAVLSLLSSACSTTPRPRDTGDEPEIPPFYRTPRPVPGTEPGYVIRHEPFTGVGALEKASVNERVLYRSNALRNDEPIAVSGLISLPEGTPPAGGWPVITWAHGTLGVADKCAPSRDEIGASAHYYNQVVHRLLEMFLRQGWAVVMTDYEGLGTEGRHPFLLGHSEARGVLDILRAAHNRYPGKLSKKFAIVGHSQGGQAALFAAADAPSRLAGTDLEPVGVIAYAPASAMMVTFPASLALQRPDPGAAFIPLYLTGAAAGDPAGVNLDTLLKPEAQVWYRDVDTKCRIELSEPDSWGGKIPFQNVMPPILTQPALIAQLNAMEPGALTITMPVRLAQGGLDERVTPLQTWNVRGQLIGNHAQVEYIGCPVADHFGVLGDDIPGALAWLSQRFHGQGEPGEAQSSCQVLTQAPPETPARSP